MRSIFSLVALSVVAVASAGTYTFTGTLTATSLKFNRPLAGNPPSGLSAVGTNVNYAALLFTVDQTGSYVISGHAVLNSTPNNDGFGVLYQTAFNPASSLTNVLQADDDTGSSPSVGNYKITRNLTAGTSYILVSTTFDNGIVGSFSDTIDGPGNINAVPEPGTMAALGLGAVAVLRRRKRAAR